MMEKRKGTGMKKSEWKSYMKLQTIKKESVINENERENKNKERVKDMKKIT